MSPLLKCRLLSLASEPYWPTGRFNFHWARGKLRHDPVFAFLLEERVFPDGARIVDLGCGRGLLAAWLLAAERLAEGGGFGCGVTPPKGLRIDGIELIAREAECGNRALRPFYGDRVTFRQGDLRSAKLQGADVIVLLDVLHYISYAEQDDFLDRVRSQVDVGKLLVARVGDASGGPRFRIGHLVDRIAATRKGYRLPRMWCRSVAGWISALESRGFVVKAEPMSRGTPFANVLLISHMV